MKLVLFSKRELTEIKVICLLISLCCRQLLCVLHEGCIKTPSVLQCCLALLRQHTHQLPHMNAAILMALSHMQNEVRLKISEVVYISFINRNLLAPELVVCCFIFCRTIIYRYILLKTGLCDVSMVV